MKDMLTIYICEFVYVCYKYGISLIVEIDSCIGPKGLEEEQP